MKLRYYQEQCLDLINNTLKTNPTKLNRYCVLPTGSGKTEIFKRINTSKMLVLVNKSTLRNQLADRFSDSSDSVLIIGGGKHLSNELLDEYNPQIVVATIQTIEKDINDFVNNYFNVIVIDEFHHTENDSRYFKVVNSLEYSLCIGFSATPPKSSMVFDIEDRLYEYSIFDAWKHNYLMKPEIFNLQLNWDKSKLSKALNNSHILWTDEDITNSFVKYTQENFELILKQLIKLNNMEKSIVYFPSIKLSDSFAEYCRERGYNAYSITSKTKDKEREFYIKEFESRRDIILSNVFVLTEGMDIPSIECIINTRPTEDKNLYKQIVGRALRLCDRKRCCKICDCVIEQSDYLFQQTFITAFCMPSTSTLTIIDKEFYENLCNELNQTTDIEKINEALDKQFQVCYELLQIDKLYCNTYDIPYYINKEKNIVYGQGISYNKKTGYNGTFVDDYDNIKFKIYFYIDGENQLHLSSKKYTEPIKFETTEECFKWLHDKYCKYDNIFENKSYTKKKGSNKLTEKQLSIISNHLVDVYNISDSIANHICNTLSKKKASSIITKMFIEDYVNKMYNN